MDKDFTIRIAQPSDALEIKDLFQDTVLNITSVIIQKQKWKIGHRVETTFPI